MDDVLFNQWGILAGATGIDFTTSSIGDATGFESNMEQQAWQQRFSAEEKGAFLWEDCAMRGGDAGSVRFQLPKRGRFSKVSFQFSNPEKLIDYGEENSFRHRSLMSIQSDRWIRGLAIKHGMIEPFSEKQVASGVVSYGLSLYGYDLRVVRRV